MSEPPFLRGGGTTGTLILARDWSQTPLGPFDVWPECLKVALATMLTSPQPMFLAWGPELLSFFNDAYCPFLGARGDGAIGVPFPVLWSDVWKDVEPIVETALRGEGSRFEDMPLVMTRNGYAEETWWTFSYMPLRDGEGQVRGMLCITTDTTAQVLARRHAAAEHVRLARLFEQAPSFMAMLEGPDHVISLANPAYRTLNAGRDVLGRAVAQALPEAVEQGYIELLDEVRRTGIPYASTGARFVIRHEPGGTPIERFVDFVYQPIVNEEGTVTGIFVEGADVTERTVAQNALRDSEQFLRSVLGASDDCIKVLDLEANLLFMSEGGQKVMDVSDFNAIRGCPWPDFWQDHGNVEAKAAVDLAKAGGTGRFSGRAATMKGTVKWWDVQVTPILGMDGKPEKLLVVSRDMTASREAEEALREAQSMNTLILNSSRDCIVVLDLDGNNLFVSPGGIAVMEIADVNAIIGLSWLRVWEGEDNSEARRAVADARAGGTGRFQGYCPTKAGTPKWWDVVISPLNGANGRPERLVSVARDITEQKSAELQRIDLMKEMSHRMKNTLSIVQAITSQTFRQARSLEESRTAIAGRLNALADASDILMRSARTSSRIGTVVESALAPHRSAETQFQIEGPDIGLNADQGLGLSLALHELATNAAKYGALSVADGHVAVRWTAEEDGAFRFDWAESGGPAVEPPRRTGFGSKLVERVVAPYFGGTSTLTFDPKGVRFCLEGRIAIPARTGL